MEFRIAFKNPGREKYERKKRFGGRTSKRGKYRHCKSNKWFSSRRTKKVLSRDTRRKLTQLCRAEKRQSRGSQQAAHREEAKKYRHFLQSQQPNHWQHWYGFQGEEEQAPSVTEEETGFTASVDNLAIQEVGAIVLRIRASSPRDSQVYECKTDRRSELEQCITGIQRQKGRLSDKIVETIHNFVKPFTQDWWDLRTEERWDERRRWDLFEEFPRARDEAAEEVHRYGVLYRRFRGGSDFAMAIDKFENRLALRDAMDQEILDYERELALLSRYSSSSSTISSETSACSEEDTDEKTDDCSDGPVIKRVECAFRVNFPHKDKHGEPSEEYVNPSTGSGYYHMEWSKVPAADCPQCHGVLARFFIRSDKSHRQTPVCKFNGSMYRKRA